MPETANNIITHGSWASLYLINQYEIKAVTENKTKVIAIDNNIQNVSPIYPSTVNIFLKISM